MWDWGQLLDCGYESYQGRDLKGFDVPESLFLREYDKVFYFEDCYEVYFPSEESNDSQFWTFGTELSPKWENDQKVLKIHKNHQQAARHFVQKWATIIIFI